MNAATVSGCLILGGGGHAKVVIDAIQASAAADRMAILDPDPGKIGKEVQGISVIGDDSVIDEAVGLGYSHFTVGYGGIGNTHGRRELYLKGLAAGLSPLSIRHPGATLSAHCRIGDGVQALAGVIVNAGAVVAENVILNTGAILEHDCRVDDHAHLGPGCRVLGGAKVGNLAIISAGSVIRQGVVIGEGAVVGAGAVVLTDVEAGMTVAGVPAVPLSRG